MLVRLEEGSPNVLLKLVEGALNVLVRLEEGGTQCVGEIGGRGLSMCW